MSSLPDGQSSESSARISLVVIQAGRHRVLIPLEHVREIMRPLSIEPLRETAPFVLGMSIIRGASVPVVDLVALLGRDEDETILFQRFVSLGLEGRTVALAVDEVIRVVEYPAQELAALPPLLEQAASGVVEGLFLADAKLHLLLSSSKMLNATTVAMETTAP